MNVYRVPKTRFPLLISSSAVATRPCGHRAGVYVWSGSPREFSVEQCKECSATWVVSPLIEESTR